MASYALWYVEATATIAREAFRKLCVTQGQHWLYYKPNGLEFKVCAEDEPHEGFELVTGEPIPSHFTVDQLIAWTRRMCGSVPVLPAD